MTDIEKAARAFCDAHIADYAESLNSDSNSVDAEFQLLCHAVYGQPVQFNGKWYPRVNCVSCGEDCSQLHFMCDYSENVGDAWCPECFATTPCGKGEHGEGCPTQVCELPPEEATKGTERTEG